MQRAELDDHPRFSQIHPIMASGDQAIQALREALRISPDNLPLRQHLAESLLGMGRPDEAELVFREALALAPDNNRLKTGLAQSFYQQGKNTHCLVLVEDVLKQTEAPAIAAMLHAKLLLRAGELDEARARYRQAVEADGSLKDSELAERLSLSRGVVKDDEEEEDDFYAADADDYEDRLRVRQSWADELPSIEIPVERPTSTFADVGGMEALKEEIRLKIIHPLTYPDLYKAYGKAIGGGILMYGPPGCGKTHLARATAGEIRAVFLAVGIHDVLDMWLGNSERNLHELFEQARRNRPCTLFFDEVDGLAASRSEMRGHGGRQLINQFLAETDGIQGNNDGLLLLAATNAPWHLDSAFRRPGRFDRILFVPPPDAPARASILRLLCRGKPVKDLDFEYLAKKTSEFSGADLKAVVDVAIEGKLRQALKAGVPQPLTTKDLATAAASVKPSTREWFATARNYAIYSNQGGLYDDVLKHLKL
jgi:transitional endoplasmic reticulum ATPase